MKLKQYLVTRLQFFTLITMAFATHLYAADGAKKQSVCDEKAEFKNSWVAGESWGNTYYATWFKQDATKSVLCVTEAIGADEKLMFKNTYLTTGKVLFTAGNCTFEGGPDKYVIAEIVDDGAAVIGAFKAWRFDDRNKRLRYVDASKVECTFGPQ